MKIKTKRVSYEYAMSRTKPKYKKPKKPNILFRTLIRLLSIPDLWSAKFTYTESRMDAAGKGPYLILMNHSSFIDLKIASRILYPLPYGIICTSDGFVGKNWLMRQIGSIPTQKFVTDTRLVKDMIWAVREKKLSILMYPEASYSFDGCATTLPRHLGKLIKKLGIPVITIITDGAFLREPLYNNLQKRKARVTAEVSCLLTRQEIQEKSADELSEILDRKFSFDNFKNQLETNTEITEPFRADGLERILYRCAACGCENGMVGNGITLTCKNCKKSYTLDTLGRLSATNGETEFSHIPDWFSWERNCVKDEILSGKYNLDIEVEIGILRDRKAVYMVGDGRLSHTADGFVLDGCDGKLHYTQSPAASYGLYADYYWYEIGDVICIGDNETLYYCFPKTKTPVAKARLAAEELFKIKKQTTEIK